MVFEWACLVPFFGSAGMFKYRESPTMDPLRGIAGRRAALTWYRKSRTHGFGGYPVTAVDLTGVLCLLAAHTLTARLGLVQGLCLVRG
jgi:hypothetical protein